MGGNLSQAAGSVQDERFVASFRCLKSCCIPVFLCPTSENAQAPIFPHFLNRAQPPVEPAGQRGALRGCVCMDFLACAGVSCMSVVYSGGRGVLVHVEGFEFCSIHAGPS